MTIGSLFSGIGGLELGLEITGLGPVKWQAECDPAALAVLATHWPDVKRYHDVREIDGKAERVSVICGGFPCQDISDAGTNHTRRGVEGARSGLWREFARIIDECRPGWVFVENVPSLAERGLSTVVRDLAALGFDAEWGVFCGCWAGAYHARQRLFLVARAHGEGEPTGAVHAQVAGVPSLSSRVRNRRLPFGRAMGMAARVSRRMDRVRLLGNSAEPQLAAYAWGTLMARMNRPMVKTELSASGKE